MSHKTAPDKQLIAIVLILLGFGMVMVFSTSAFTSGDYQVFIKHSIFTLLGLAVMFVAMQFNYTWLTRTALLYPLLGLTVVLLLVTLTSPPINNAHRWIVLGPLRAQPSELAKLVMILFTSYYVVRYRERLNNLKNGLIPYLIVLSIMTLLILVEPDLGTAASVVLISGVLLYLGGLHYKYIVAGILAAAPLLYLAVFRVPYRRDRLLAFLNPEEFPMDIGYQIRQSLIAVGSGGISGVGLAQSKQKLNFLPESHTDFIFAIVAEELGLIGCLLLLTLFLLLFRRGVQIALRAADPVGTLIGLGIVAMIVLQALINMSVVISLVPTKGIPLPFISVGGSSLLVTMAAIGILLSISRNSRAEDARPWFRGSD